MKTRGWIFVCAATIALAGLAVSCASTSQTTRTSRSGFLGDYSQLKPGEKGQAQLVYFNKGARFDRYNKILMDPIAVYASGANSNLDKVPEDELRQIINYFDSAVRTELGQDYEFVTTPGPDTMRLRIAVTEAKGANVALNTVSSITPVSLALSGLKKGLTGASTGVGRAGVEMELVDSQSNKRLLAGVDERAGSKLSSFSKWEGVKEAYDYWAKRLRQRLAEFRAG